MRWWGLVRAMPGTRDDGSSRMGMWRITRRGRAFIERRVKVRKYLYEWDNDLFPDIAGADTSTIWIDEINEFDYGRIMKMI